MPTTNSTTPANPPALVRALRTALFARQPRLDPADVPPLLFVETVVTCDAADRRYRATIEATLAANAAREILATTSAFRARVRDVRAAIASETAALFTRSGHVPIEIDPLDLATPRISGLSHVDLVRLADLGDRARASVRTLRADANERIAPLLDATARETLVEAKRERNVAFSGAVHADLVPLGKRVERFSDTVEALASLADGWY